MKKIVGTTIIFASLAAGFLVAIPPAEATPDGQVTVRVDDPAAGEYNVNWSVTTQQELDLAADIDCHQLTSKEDCVAFANNCICSEASIREHSGFLPDYAILVMDINS